MSKTRYEWTLVDFALFTVGAVVVPIYETSSAEQVEWILSDSGARGVSSRPTSTRRSSTSVRDRSARPRDVWTIDDGAIDALVRDGAEVADDDVTKRRAGRDPRRPRLDHLHLGHDRPPQGLPAAAPQLRRRSAPSWPTVLRSFFNEDTSTLLFLPIAHVFGRVIEIGALHVGCTLGHTPDVKNLLDDLAEFKPTFVLAVPRVFEKVYNARQAEGARRRARARSSTAPRAVAIAYSEARRQAGPLLAASAQHAVFDKLVYSKLRAALGGECVAAVSGGAPLGARLGHFFRGIGVTIYEGYGLTETTAGICVNRPELDPHRHGRPAGRRRHRAHRRRRRAARARSPMVFAGYWQNDDATAEAHRRRRLVPHRRHRRDRRRRLRPDHRAQEGADRHRGRQERRAGRARGPGARALAGQPVPGGR